MAIGVLRQIMNLYDLSQTAPDLGQPSVVSISKLAIQAC